MGKIAPGHLADFALLDKDYFTVPEDQIKTISSVLTVVDGRVVFGAQAFTVVMGGSTLTSAADAFAAIARRVATWLDNQ